MSIVVTLLPSMAAIANTIITVSCDTVGDDRLPYNVLSCPSPPATSRALSLSNSQDAVNFSVRNIELLITLLNCVLVSLDLSTISHTSFSTICPSSFMIDFLEACSFCFSAFLTVNLYACEILSSALRLLSILCDILLPPTVRATKVTPRRLSLASSISVKLS